MKKLTLKRLFAAILAVCMIAAMFSGCNKDPGVTDATKNPGVTNGTEPTGGSEKPAEPTVFKFTVCTKPEQGDWNDYYVVKYVEEKYNVDLQFEMISSDAWKEKYPLMFLTGELPDAITGSSIDQVTYGSQGYLIPLEDYISAENTPNIWKMFQENPSIKGYITELDGHIYNLAGADAQLRGLSRNIFYVNTDWTHEILGKNPETLDEFYQYLVGVRDRDMDGDGNPNNEIPISGYYNATNNKHMIQFPILAAYGYVSTDFQVSDDGKMFYVPVQDNYKEYLKYMNKLYTEKLLDQEFFTQTEDQFCVKDTQGLLGAYCYTASFKNHVEEEDFKRYDTIAPLTSQYNQVKMNRAYDISVIGQLYVTEDCENPELLMKVMDWFFSEEAYIMNVWGFAYDSNPDYPGYGYKDEMTEDGRSIVFYGPEGVNDAPGDYESFDAFKYAVLAPNIKTFPLYRSFSVVYSVATEAWLEHNIVDNTAEYFKAPYPRGMKFTTEEESEISLFETDLAAYLKEMEAKMITGELDIDATWSTFVEGLKSRGLEQCLAIYQTAYDRYVENSK